MRVKDYYLKHPDSDEMSEFTTLEGNTWQIRITHFLHWGKARSDAESKVVDIFEARDVWRKLVSHGYAREDRYYRLRALAQKNGMVVGTSKLIKNKP